MRAAWPSCARRRQDRRRRRAENNRYHLSPRLWFHRSRPNTTGRMRRVYLTQYSAEPILGADGGLWSQAVPFLRGGAVVYDHAADRAARAGSG